MICNVCEGTGFINLHQISETELNAIQPEFHDSVLKWMASNKEPHDVRICDCCGDGEAWHGEPGKHYGSDDPPGSNGPYAYNGGLCECN